MEHLAKPYPWQNEQWTFLHSLIKQNRLPHALLVEGAKGIGKRQLALSLGSFLLCKNPVEVSSGDFTSSFSDNSACGQCRSCRLNLAGTHPDLLLISPEEKSSVIKVDQIRFLIDFVSKTSQQGGKKIIIIDPAEAMNINSANALLKSLEEPTADTFLILVSHQSSKLLPTIKSRCQLLECAAPDHDSALQWLAGYGGEERAALLLRLSDGRPIAALDMLNSEAMEIREALSKDLLGLIKQTSPLVSICQKWSKGELEIVLFWLSCWLGDMLRWMPTDDLGRIRDVSQMELYNLCKERGQYKTLFPLMDELMLARQQLEGGSNPNKQLLLENVLIKWLGWLGG